MWSHAYGRSMGYLHVLWSRGCKIPYVYLTCSVRFTCGPTKGTCGFLSGMGTSVSSVLREPYGPVRMPCGLGNTRTISGGSAFLGPVRPATVRSGYVYQVKHDYVKRANKTTNWPSMGTCRIRHARLSTDPKSSETHLWKLYILIFQPRVIRARIGPKPHEKSYKAAARSYTQSNQSFRCALNWQTTTQSFGV